MTEQQLDWLLAVLFAISAMALVLMIRHDARENLQCPDQIAFSDYGWTCVPAIREGDAP